MTTFFVAASLALAATAAYANDQSDHWFNDGARLLPASCGMQAFVKYGKSDTPEVRRSCYLTQRQPEMCAKLFP